MNIIKNRDLLIKNSKLLLSKMIVPSILASFLVAVYCLLKFESNVFSFISLIVGLLCFLLALIIFFYSRRKEHSIWGFFNISVFVWCVGCFLIAINGESHENSILSWKLFVSGITFIPVLFFHFVFEYCKAKFRGFLIFCYVQAIIFLIINIFTSLLVNTLIFQFNEFYYLKANFLYTFYFLIWSLIVFVSFVNLFKYYMASVGLRKVQSAYIFYGMLIGFLGGTTTAPQAWSINIYPAGHFLTGIYAAISTYAIFKYKLIDIKIAITRTGIFVTIYSLILGIPFFVAFNYGLFLAGALGGKWWLVPMGLLTVLATVGPFIYIFVQKKAEERLLREQRQYQSTLRQASSGMIRVRELKRLLNLIVHVVTRAVKLEFASIYLFDSDNRLYKMAARRDSSKLPEEHTIGMDTPLINRLLLFRDSLVYEEVQLQSQDNPRNAKMKSLERQLKEMQASVVIPSFVGNKMLGFIVLGKKKSGKIFSQDDLNVFSVLANQAALAIENAQFYEDIKETQEQLFQAEKMATIGTMADGLSHQINNRFQALSLISGDSLDILKTTEVSNCSDEVKDAFSQLKYAFERVQSNVIQGGEIVRGLLKYSRPGQSGFEQIDFNQVIDGALEMAQYKVRLQELDIVRNIPKDLPKLRCNLTQLEEIFFNMIDNANDAIIERKELLKDENYKGRIEISARSEDGHMRIVFQDNGIGVKDKDREKLFTPFFTTKATNRQGTGLGLYVIQKIVSFHNGTIAIDSTYNKGMTFDILLPLTKQ